MTPAQRIRQPSPPRTGWPPGLLQDDCYELAHWFASKPDARRLVREACQRIREQRRTNEHTI